jgi:hypothetical protein
MAMTAGMISALLTPIAARAAISPVAEAVTQCACGEHQGGEDQVTQPVGTLPSRHPPVNEPEPTQRRRLAVEEPASFVAFEVLAADRADLRQLAWTERGRDLETLAQGCQPPMQLSLVTSDLTEAERWLSAFSAAGVEGLVVKGCTQWGTDR